MPEPEPKPESKPSEKPSEAQSTAPEGTQPQGQAPRRGGKQYVDYNTLPPGEAAIMLKRIRARIKRIERDLDDIMNILKYGANAGIPSQGQGQQGQGGYSRGYRRGYSGSNYGGRGSYGGGYGGRSYGGRRYSRRTSSEEDEDVNY
jgi:hypothetical protein